MKFLHTGDWHIGKKLNGFELLTEQKAAFEAILAIAKAEQVDGIIVAGDLYDRSVPAVEAVEVFNEMMLTLNIKERYPVFAIAGNHDSSTRLETGGPWFEQLQFHLHTRLEQAFEPIEFGDVQLYLLPYFEPFHARHYFEDTEIRTIEQGMIKVVAEMEKSFKPEMQQVLVAHFFVAGSQKSDSETKVMVGGLDVVPLSLLVNFDYVALGHLHNKNALQGDNVRYSGSLLKYSLSELNQTKGVWVVELVNGDVNYAFHEVQPMRALIKLEEDFATLMDPIFYQSIDREAYIAIVLTDRGVIPNVMTELRKVYPRVIQLERAFGRERENRTVGSTTKIKQASPIELIQDYFQETTGDQLTDQQQEWLSTEMIALQTEQ